MNTVKPNTFYQQFLHNIIEEDKYKPLTIRSEVAQTALQSEDIKDFFEELLRWGCQSGMVHSLIYYSDTHNFYDSHYDEIETLREEYELSTGQSIQIKGDLKNFFAWFAFEETAYQLCNEMGLGLVI